LKLSTSACRRAPVLTTTEPVHFSLTLSAEVSAAPERVECAARLDGLVRLTLWLITREVNPEFRDL